MKVNELAQAAGVSAHTVRFYVRAGLLRPSRDASNGYARFAWADVARLQFIRRAKRLGFTLTEIQTIFQMAERAESPCPMVRQIVSARLVHIREQIDDITAAEARIRCALKTWRSLPDATPTGTQVCRLIEMLSDEQ